MRTRRVQPLIRRVVAAQIDHVFERRDVRGDRGVGDVRDAGKIVLPAPRLVEHELGGHVGPPASLLRRRDTTSGVLFDSVRVDDSPAGDGGPSTQRVSRT